VKKVKLKQGTLVWEKAKSTRIGSSEVFDIVRYYATDDELQNCGINAERFREESPYTTAWALYHKILNDGVYKREELAPEYAEYGHAVEPYGLRVLQRGRGRKLKAGEVYADDRLIASVDISGIAEEIDIVPFDFGYGKPKSGQKFVCEQKTMNPLVVKKGIPYKYIIQAQYQILKTKSDFYILQIMILNEDNVFLRGKISQMSPIKRYKYLDDNMTVKHLYFHDNIQLSCLIETCLDRFFEDVDNMNEPTPYIVDDSTRNIMKSIWLNSSFDSNKRMEWDLNDYVTTKSKIDFLERRRKGMIQELVEHAMCNNACIFDSPTGHTAKFSRDGKLLIKDPEVV
jgi:hypothetical protein